MSPKSNDPLYPELRKIEEATGGRDLTDEEFERITEIQDQIYDNDIIGVDGNDSLGEMHPWHTGTIPKERFDKMIQKTVTIPGREAHAGFTGNLITITLNWICPVCEGPRGEIFTTHSFDGSRRLNCDGWRNACGHIDKYSEVRKEAARPEPF